MRILALLSVALFAVHADAAAPKFNDPKPQAYHLTVRASALARRTAYFGSLAST